MAAAAFSPGWLPAQCPDGTPPPCAARAARPSVPPPTSVAVLYLDNLSRDTADAYLADGLTEELTSRLGAVERLRVTGRSAVRRAQTAAAGDLALLGRSLGVRYLVEGSVRRSGSRVRISVRLLRAADGVRVWGGDYDRNASDVLDIQEEVAREVVTNVAGRLLPAERASVASRPTSNPAAYDHLLRGNHYLARRTATAIERALAEYDAAIRLDAEFARAWGQTGYAYALLYFYRDRRTELAPESILARGFAAVERALRLDSSDADAWRSLGSLLLYRYPHAPDSGLPAHRRSVALAPRNADSWHSLGFALGIAGDLPGAREAYLRALSIEPGRPVTLSNLAQYEHWQGRPESALSWADSALAVDPSFVSARAWRAIVWLRLDSLSRARQDAEVASRLGSRVLEAAAALIAVTVATGDTAQAKNHLETLLATLPDSTAPAPWEGLWVGIAIMALGDDARAIEFLERVRPRGGQLAIYLRDPAFDRLRANPRYERLLAESLPPSVLPR